MPRPVLPRRAPLAMLLAAALALVSPAAAQDAPAPARSVTEGVFTEEQAQAGRDAFAENCAYCHSESQFKGAWMRTWNGRNLGLIYQFISSSMPYDGPGRLAPAVYAQVISYLLDLNGYPTGDTELPDDAAALAAVRVEPVPSSSGSPSGR